MSVGTTAYRESRTDLVAAIILLFSVCAFGVLLWNRQAALLSLVYPGAALMIGGWLYIARPTAYLGFTWWLWFITPFVRRIVDYQMGQFTPASPVMLAPLLVTGLSLFSIFRFGRLLMQRMYFPFLLSMLGVVYGFLVGVVKVGVFSATYSLLEWLLPLFLGFHVLLFWREYPEHRRVVRATFTWGVLLMGIYGVFQYVYPPAWDMHWLVGSGMTSSMGSPEAFGFRVFSTFNSTGAFAYILTVGLLLLFDGKRFLAHLAVLPGYVSFLLTLVRAHWLGWVFGLLSCIALLKGKLRGRLIVVLVLGIMIGVPAVLYTPSAGTIRSRAGTLTSLDEDRSLNARMNLYARASSQVLTTPIGRGIGGTGMAAKLSTGNTNTIDSGLLIIPLTFGWLGTLMYVGGLVWMLRNAFRSRRWRADQFAVIAMSVVLTNVFLLIATNTMILFGGCVQWSFLALVLASEAYHEQRDHAG